jgi:hypothetical protein
MDPWNPSFASQVKLDQAGMSIYAIRGGGRDHNLTGPRIRPSPPERFDSTADCFCVQPYIDRIREFGGLGFRFVQNQTISKASRRTRPTKRTSKHASGVITCSRCQRPLFGTNSFRIRLGLMA